MSFRDDLRKHLSDDMYQQVTDALGDDFNYDVVPRSRLNKVIGQRDKLKLMIEGEPSGTQQGGGSQSHNSEGNFKMPIEKGKKKDEPTIEELRKQWQAEQDAKMEELKVHFAGVDMLRGASAVDPELVFSLLDKSKLKLGEDGKLTGLDDQLTAMKEARPYLFTAQQGGRKSTPGGTGKQGGAEQFEGVKNKAEFLKLSVEDQIKFKEAHPDVFKSYLAQP